MRSLDDVTEEEIQTEYDNTPAISKYVPWSEVLENQIFKTLLINQIISREEKVMEKMPETKRIFLAINNESRTRIHPVNEPQTVMDLDWSKFKKVPADDLTGAIGQPEKQLKRRSTITLYQGQVEKLKTALCLSRNCLTYGGMSDAVRNEALESIAESQKIINSFYEPRG